MRTDPATLTGAYAVNALTGDEQTHFEGHLADCEECEQEVRELRETAARLGATAATTPPANLRDRVLTQIASTRQEPPASPSEPRKGRTDELAARRSRWGVRFAVAAAALGIALAGAFGVTAVRSYQALQDTRQQMEQASTRGQEMAHVLGAQDAAMVSADSNGIRGTTVISHELGKAMFMSTGMTEPPGDQVHQLWFIGPSGATSAGMLKQDSAGRTTPIVAPLPPDTTQMGVTVEPAGGSAQPTTAPMLMMKMPA